MKKSIPLTILAIILVVIYLLPVFWMVISSFKTEKEIYRNQPIPSGLYLENYAYLFDQSEILRWTLNSFVISLLTTIGVVIITLLAAYPLGMLEFSGRKILFYLVLAGLMIPLQGIMIPRYLLLRDLHLLNTYWALILPALASPLNVIIVSQFFKGIPREFKEAAEIDGAKEHQILFRVIAPIAKPAIVAIATFTFVGTWNDFLWPLIVMTENKMYTLPVGLATFYGTYTLKWGVTMAGNVIAAIPILIFFAIFQKQLIEGITLGGLKE